jgi:hypothetical protein
MFCTATDAEKTDTVPGPRLLSPLKKSVAWHSAYFNLATPIIQLNVFYPSHAKKVNR